LNSLKIEINTLEYKEYSTVKHNGRTNFIVVVIAVIAVVVITVVVSCNDN
jgi:hypothetical protein